MCVLRRLRPENAALRTSERRGRILRRPTAPLQLSTEEESTTDIITGPAVGNSRGHRRGNYVTIDTRKTCIGTLVERTTRFVLLLKLEKNTAEAVRVAMSAKILTLPAELRRSVTWDRGTEMSQHLRFTVDTGVQVYFCDPKSPWQRGTNENTNGLLRQYFAKGTDLSAHSQADLDTVARELNEHPRQTLGWVTPSQRLAEVVALTG